MPAQSRSADAPVRASARATAALWPARLPACDIAAATAHRQAPRARDARRARGVARASMAADRYPRADLQISANRDGIVCIVKSAGLQMTISSHVTGAETRRTGCGTTE